MLGVTLNRLPLTLLSALTAMLTRPAAGEGWWLAGDRVQSVDPLSSSGIANAIQHAELIADALLRSRSLHRIDPSRYLQWLEANHHDYLEARQTVYGGERRWPFAFWQRRQSQQPELA